MIRKVLISLSLSALCIVMVTPESRAQFCASGQLSYGLSGVGHLIGGGIEAGYGLGAGSRRGGGSKFFIGGMFNYYAGASGSGTFDATALSSINPIQDISVPYSYSFSILHATAVARYFWVGDMSSSFSLYGQLGIGIEYMPVRYVVAPFDQVNYDNSQMPVSENNLGFVFMGGIGMDVAAGPGHLFFVTRLVVPANESNGVAIDVVVPASFNLDLGYRYIFGEGSGGSRKRGRRRH